jgi:hypothetical protein
VLVAVGDSEGGRELDGVAGGRVVVVVGGSGGGSGSGGGGPRRMIELGILSRQASCGRRLI